MGITQMLGHSLQIRHEEENTAFRIEMFGRMHEVYRERWTIPLDNRAAHQALDDRIDEMKLERARAWVALYERQFREIERSPEAVFDKGRIDDMKDGLEHQRREVVRLSRMIALRQRESA